MGQRTTHGWRAAIRTAIIIVAIGTMLAAFCDMEYTAPETDPAAVVQATQPESEVLSKEPWKPEDYDYALMYDVSPDAFEHLAEVKPNGVIKTFDCVIQSVDSNGITCIEPGGNYISLDASGNPGDVIQVSAFLVFV